MIYCKRPLENIFSEVFLFYEIVNFKQALTHLYRFCMFLRTMMEPFSSGFNATISGVCMEYVWRMYEICMEYGRESNYWLKSGVKLISPI